MKRMFLDPNKEITFYILLSFSPKILKGFSENNMKLSVSSQTNQKKYEKNNNYLPLSIP